MVVISKVVSHLWGYTNLNTIWNLLCFLWNYLLDLLKLSIRLLIYYLRDMHNVFHIANIAIPLFWSMAVFMAKFDIMFRNQLFWDLLLFAYWFLFLSLLLLLHYLIIRFVVIIRLINNFFLMFGFFGQIQFHISIFKLFR